MPAYAICHTCGAPISSTKKYVKPKTGNKKRKSDSSIGINTDRRLGTRRKNNKTMHDLDDL